MVAATRDAGTLLVHVGVVLQVQTVLEEALRRRGDGVSDQRRNYGGVGNEMKLFQVMDCERMEIENGGCGSDS